MKKVHYPVEVDNESDEQDVAAMLPDTLPKAIVSGTDWTAETIVGQLQKGNILLNPRFQRRDAWDIERKSKFIESLIEELPIPQIVLAESQPDRAKFLVLDGKQRLLSILQFWGLGDGKNNSFALVGLPMRKDLIGKTHADLAKDPAFADDFRRLTNQTIRTSVIRGWKDTTYLHTVFLRLNTGSVNLSPQELRQALLPGSFSDYADDAAGASKELRALLGIGEPDPRMRDIEIFARFLAFRFFAINYPGRMKKFLDNTFKTFNDDWPKYRPAVEAAKLDFEAGVTDLLKIFGEDDVARKPTSPQFNRAIFDALIYYQSQANIRKYLKGKHAQLRKAYDSLFAEQSGFAKSVESDTAGAPNTAARLSIWGEALTRVSGHKITIPVIRLDGPPIEKGGQVSRKLRTK